MDRVIVAGGGPGGLAAAVALRRVGIETAVFERAPELREVGAGLSLWSNAVAALCRIGPGGAVVARGTVVERAAGWGTGHGVITTEPTVRRPSRSRWTRSASASG